MTDSVRRYVPHSPGALLEWDPSQDTGLAVVIADDYDKLVARLAASEAERDRLAGSLAACGVIAGCDNAESFERWKLADDNPYRTDSSAAVTRLRAECSMFERQSTEWMLLAERNARECDSLRAKLAKLEVDAAWGAHNGGAHTLIKMHHADAMELWQALNDLSFACDGVLAPCPPTHKVYNETFAIMNKHRQAYSKAARESSQCAGQSSEKGL